MQFPTLGEGRGEGLPEQIGSYRIRRIIAAGGMGTVYEAEQTHPHRTVALKVMKREYGLRGRRALRRFEYESEILASLRHPGIAQVYEAGTHDDGSGAVPYFAMEFIPNAKPITKYADEHKLSIRQRLELFAEVCDAVHHGHQKGIIHRDLKPGNILVGADDDTCKAATSGRGLVKIIDFGIARATDSDIAVTTMHTDVRELIGTLQYMSPEQCAGDPRDLDIRSDVYSLGVVLYELLCGQLPYDLSHTPIPQATRVIQDAEPPRPSTISKRLKGNLEAIVLKALEKDRAKRFDSTADLVRNIRNHLAGEPLDIRPPSRFAFACHWLVKHPILTTSAACVTIAALTLAATSISVWYLNARPHHIELTPDGREARLMSVRSNILHTWGTEANDGIRFAQLVDRPPELGGGKLAIIGFSQNHTGPTKGSLCGYPARGDRKTPLWTARIRQADLPTAVTDHAYKADAFGIHWGHVQDVFPERPGLEVIANYQHAPGSACAIRVYDMSGEVLYQIWHDGSIGSRYWMVKPRLLVLCGLNSEVYWPQRGYPELRRTHPVVMFAVRPTLGHIGERIVTITPGGDMTTVAFYKCLRPPLAIDLIGQILLSTPVPGEDASRYVQVNLHLRSNANAAVSWLIDETGNEIPNSRHTVDAWKLDGGAPEPEVFYLGELPAIISTPE